MKYIIDFVDYISDIEITSYLTENNCEMIKVYNNFSKVYLVNSQIRPPITSIVESVIDDNDIIIAPLGEIISVNNYCGLSNPSFPSITISTVDEKDWWKNYVIRYPKFESQTYDISRKGTGVNVYIMDSGIESTHPEFSNSTIVNLFSITDSYIDSNGHGTAIASIISGKTCGLTNATLKIIKIFDSSISTRQSDLLNALDTILEDFKNYNQQSAVLNCSWSIEKNQYIENKLRVLIEQGISVVVAAGNSGIAIENVTPASMPEVLTIGSYNNDFLPSNFSNYSNPTVISNTENTVNSGQLDGWAPGEQIWVAALGGGYGYAAGTSLSAAIQSSALAYNTSDLLSSDYNTPKVLQNLSINDMIFLSVSRNGLLELSDPKYVNSKNNVATLYNEIDYSSIILPYEYDLIIPLGTHRVWCQPYNPHRTKTVEIVADLPYGFYIMNNGKLAGSYDSTLNGNYQRIDSLIRITDIYDGIRDIPLIFRIIGPEFDDSQIPANDPFIGINFLLGPQTDCVVPYCNPAACGLVGCGGTKSDCNCNF